MELESVPKILEIPSKLYEMIVKFNSFRYFLIEGGRASGKSQSVARFILYLASKRNLLRIICAREIQVNLAESSYTLLTDLIQKYDLDFEISASKIVSRATGSTITFRGFREQNRFSIQGIEGASLIWCDESQAISADTIRVLIPTVRAPQSKLIFTLNRYLPNDAIYEFLINRSDSLHIHCDYTDNPFCPQSMILEAEECRKRSEVEYLHVWKGSPADAGDDVLFTRLELEESKSKDFPLVQGYGERIMGCDIGRYGTDSSAVLILEQRDQLHWQEVFSTDWQGRDLNWTAGNILKLANEYKVGYTAIDEQGLGGGVVDSLAHGHGLDKFVGFINSAFSFERNKNFGNNRTLMAYKLKDLLTKGHVSLKNPKLIDELNTAIKYSFDHNQRKIKKRKEKLGAEGIASPNLADSALICMSLMSRVVEPQEQPYQPKQASYSSQPWNPFKNDSDGESLFGIAGVI